MSLEHNRSFSVNNFVVRVEEKAYPGLKPAWWWLEIARAKASAYRETKTTILARLRWSEDDDFYLAIAKKHERHRQRWR
jgi:hypothetical protein